MGGEVAGKDIANIVQKHGGRLSVARAEDHTRQAIVERYNKTIRMMLGKYMQASNTKKWVDVLPAFVKNYNSNFQSGIKAVPNNVFTGKEKPVVRQPTKEALNQMKKFNYGDKVRRLLNRNTFQKSGKPRWSEQIYTIDVVFAFSFKLKSSNGRQLQGTYRPYELQKVDVVEKEPEKRGVLRGDAKYREMPVERPKTRGKRVDLKKLGVKK